MSNFPPVIFPYRIPFFYHFNGDRVTFDGLSSGVIDFVDVAALLGFAQKVLIPRALLKRLVYGDVRLFLAHILHVIDTDLAGGIEIEALLRYRLSIGPAPGLWYNQKGGEHDDRRHRNEFFHKHSPQEY
jgi:hypothetical protein